MISVVVCTKDHGLFSELSKNIVETIGMEYEIIPIDNSLNTLSIFEAYKKGVSLSSGEIICFLHEDILFHTKDWGLRLKDTFKDESVGIAGVVGSYRFTQSMIYWSDGLTAGQLMQGSYSRFGKYHLDKTPGGCPFGESVLCVDGLFLSIRKRLFDENIIKWDTDTFSGFHFYDVDICLQSHNAGFQTKICDIKIEHKSCGECTDKFYESARQFRLKWRNELPMTSQPDNLELIEKHDDSVFARMCSDRKSAALLKKWPFTWLVKVCRYFHIYGL